MNEVKDPRATAAEVLNEMEGLKPIVTLRKGVQQIRKERDRRVVFS